MKNKNVLLICCIFGGWFGLHHFVNGKIGKGLIYLFTVGLFCIGWIYDIFVIATAEEKKKFTISSNERTVYRFEVFNDNKRKSLYSKTRTKRWFDDYIVFDLETTGLNANDDMIIEIGAIKYKNNEPIETFQTLINPKCRLSKEIVEITGITDNMLKNCETIDQVLPKFINFIEDYTLIAHNGSFDLGFIEKNIEKLNLKMIENKNIDTLYLARENINTPNHKLETLKKHFDLNYNSHRALEDCKTTNFIYQYCKDKNTVK